MTKTISFLSVVCLLSTVAWAETPTATSTCKMQATDKKLAGAALKSFMTKCQTDAKADCDKQAGDKKLAGAAKNSFTKKCVTDEVGT
jgi:hypothetical protein